MGGGSRGWVTSRGLWVNAAAKEPVLGVSSLPDTGLGFRSKAMPGIASIVPRCLRLGGLQGTRGGGSVRVCVCPPPCRGSPGEAAPGWADSES